MAEGDGGRWRWRWRWREMERDGNGDGEPNEVQLTRIVMQRQDIYTITRPSPRFAPFVLVFVLVVIHFHIQIFFSNLRTKLIYHLGGDASTKPKVKL